MDTTALQARLSQLTHLLPSQQEWLERLLFQLAFNDVQRVDIVGPAGSGKSTLALALAELFSEHYNVALLHSRTEPDQVNVQLMQQWFGQPFSIDMTLAEQVANSMDLATLVLIIDDTQRYTAELIQQLASLPCILLCFSAQTPADAGLTLTLNRITAADAAQLLQPEALNSIELADRLASANGNLYRLLQPAQQALVSAVALPISSKKAKQAAVVLLAVIVILVLAYRLWPASTTPEAKATMPASISPVPAAIDSDAVVTTIPDTNTAQADIDTASVVADDVEPLTPDITGETVTAVVENAVTDIVVPSADVDLDIADEGEQAVTADINPVESSYLYDEAKLLQMANSQVAVQLAVLSSDAALKRFQKAYPELAVVSFQRTWQGKMQLVLLLAPYDNTEAAKTVMAQLPAALRATGLFVKGLQAVQSEIKARQVSLRNDVE